MAYKDKRWLLSIGMSFILAVTMLFTPTTVLAAGEEDMDQPTVTDSLYNGGEGFVNSDGQAVKDAYVSEDGFIYRIVNSDGTETDPNWVAKVYGDLNATGKTEIDIPNELGGYPVVSSAMDPRYPVGDESYDSVEKLNLPGNLAYHHYFRFFDLLTDVAVDGNNPKYVGGDDGVLYKKHDDGWSVELYPRGKTDRTWIMPDQVNRNYSFYEGCPLESVTIGANLEDADGWMFWNLNRLKEIKVSANNKVMYADGGVLFKKDTENMYDIDDQIIGTRTVHVLEFYPPGKTDKTYTIPEGVIRINESSIHDVPALEKLTLPKTIESIEDDFLNCENLRTIAFTADKAPQVDEYGDYNDYEGLRDALKENLNLEITYPENGEGYEEFILWLKRLFAPIPANPEAIRLNEKKAVNIETAGEVKTFAFTPSVTGDYYFESVNDTDWDTKGAVFTKNGFVKESDDYNYSEETQNRHFRAYFRGEAGVTYYLQAKLYSKEETGSFTVHLAEGTDPDDNTGEMEPFADIPENPESIAVNDEKEIVVGEGEEGKVVTYAFTPKSSGRYAFLSVGSEDTKGCVLTVDKVIDANDDNGEDDNFRVCFDAEAGVTYYLQATLWDKEKIGSFSVRLQDSTVEEHEHIWSTPEYEWAEDLSAVTATRRCEYETATTECGLEETETATVTKTVVKPATCTELGRTKYTAAFTNAGFKTQTKTLTDIEPSHKLVKTDAKAATCTEPGAEAHWTCSVCKKTYADAEGKTEIAEPKVVPAVGHKWNKGVETKAPSCENAGVLTFTCETCGKTRTEAIDPKGHTAGKEKIENRVEATCSTEGGYDTVVRCTVCKTILSSEHTVIPATGHRLTETPAAEATFDSEGNRAYWTCGECGKIFGDAEGRTEIAKDSWILPKLVPAEGDAVKTEDGATVAVTNAKSRTVAYKKASPKKKSVTIPATVRIGDNTYKIVQIGSYAFKGTKATKVTANKNIKIIKKNAFKSSKVKTLTLKTKKLTKKSVKNSLKGSKVKTIKVKVGKKKDNKKYVKKYKKIFTKKNAGKKASVK